MKKKIDELLINPINPRRIRGEQKRRLQQSIMLFPKMLGLRDIIINKENRVLAGNQRTAVLKEIANSSPLDWMLVLQQNEKWVEMTEAKREEVVEYWRTWAENPEVEVTVADLNEDEEKELIIKDNAEYGEFDYGALLQIFDEVNLINFGMDEDLFYNPDEDDTVINKMVGSKPKKINMLSFGKAACAVTKEEYFELVKVYNDYVDAMTVSYGFVKFLLEQKGYTVSKTSAANEEDDELEL